MSKEHYSAQIFSPDKTTALYAMLAMTECAEDPAWIAEQLAKLTQHDDADISGLAITCFGHLARIRGTVGDFERVCALLEQKRTQPELAGRVQDALDDFAQFLHEWRTR